MSLKGLFKKLEKYSMKEVPVKAELHLFEQEMRDLPRIDEGVRVVEIEGKAEFGFEDDIDDPNLTNITAGGIVLTLSRNDLMEAYHNYLMREAIERKMQKIEVVNND